MENITQDAQRAPEVQETSVFEAGIFSPNDLAIIAEFSDAPRGLQGAAKLLAEFAQSEPIYAPRNGDGRAGRFAFCEFGKTAKEIQAMFRLCRQSLDFLEVDFKVCARESGDFYRKQVSTFDSISPKSPSEQIADLYWQVQESLRAGDLSFDDLIAYHAQSDSEVQS